MMNSKFISIYKLIDSKRLKEVYKRIYFINLEIRDDKIKEDLDLLYSSYNAMLDKFQSNRIDGIKQDNHNDYLEILSKTYEITDRLFIEDSLKNINTHYLSLIKKKRENPGYTLSELQVQLETYSHIIDTFDSCDVEENIEKSYILEAHDISIDELFDKIIATTIWSEDDEADSYEIISSCDIKDYDKAILISAITISLLNYFDANKFKFLLRAYNLSNKEVTQRSAVGIGLVSLRHEKRIMLYPEIISILERINKDDYFINDICNVQLLLLMTKETNRISKTVREEIMPKFFESNSDIKYINNEDIESQQEMAEKIIENEEYAMNRMEELHQSGADICMNTFSALKHDKFFNIQSHWFFPFFEEQKDIVTIAKEYKKNSLLLFLLKIGYLCNSDKYSFCLTLLKIPKRQRDSFIKELNSKDVFAELGIKATSNPTEETNNSYKVCELYIHDLYRYFKLWKYKNEIEDVFDSNFELWKCKPLQVSLNNFNVMYKIALYNLKYEHYDQAIRLLSDIAKQKPSDVNIWQKLGLAHQKNGEYEEAVEDFLKADVIKSDSQWLNYHLAQCYYRINDFKSALFYYLKIEKNKPDNLSTEMQIGYCYAHLKDYENALKYLFKVEYLEKRPLQARKAIAWCYFLSHRYSESTKYYKQIIRNPKADSFDFMNYSHALFANHEIIKAVKYYKKALSKTNSSEFITMYRADRQHLLDSNIREADIEMMLDIVL